jgi:hypothetical protein
MPRGELGHGQETLPLKLATGVVQAAEQDDRIDAPIGGVFDHLAPGPP